MGALKSGLSADAAINAAFEFFEKYVRPHGGRMSHVLLEGLQYVDTEDAWMVIIGFDVGRERETGSPLGFGERTKEPIRETRQFFISASDGNLIRMV